MLGNRLKACSELVSAGGVCCDVGTDHAYLPIELILSGRCRRAIACDINRMPLEAGRENAEKHGVADRIDFVLSDGLAQVDLSGVTDVVIAGMGGELIFEIISRCLGLKNGIRLILQPMTRAELLRRQLYAVGYEIERECAVDEKEFVYSVMAVKYTGVCRDIDIPTEYLGGLTASSAADLRYAERLLIREGKIAEGLEKSDAPTAAAELRIHREIIKAVSAFLKSED